MDIINQKELSQIHNDREDSQVANNIDLYEAIAGLAEDLADISTLVGQLATRVTKLEQGGVTNG